MGTTTTYDVLLRYRLANNATADADKLRHKLAETGHTASELGRILGSVGAIAGGYMGIHGAWEHLVKFNSEVENAKISLTAMVEGGFGGSFAYAKGQAEALYNEFQKFSTQTPMTTQEMLEFSRGVAVSTQQAGGSIQDIVTITEQGAVAAKALGMESHYAARELSEMLSGTINNRMLFAKQLAGLGGKTTEDLRAMSSGERLAFLKQTLTSPAMKDAVGAMSSSFSGVTSTMIDKIQILLGKVGLPLFKAITAEVSRWNQWIDKNQEAIDHFANSVAEGLVDAFRTVKDVFSFIYDHADTFIAIGKTWAAIKIGQGIGGMLGIGGGGGLAGNLGSNVSQLGGGQVLGPALAAGVGGYELAKALGADRLGTALGDAAFTIHSKLGLVSSDAAKHAEAIEELTKQMAELSAATQHAAFTLNGTGEATYASNMVGTFAYENAQLQKMLAEQRAGGGSFDKDREIERLQSHLSEVGGRFTEASFGGMAILEMIEHSALTEYQRQTLNEQKAANEIFRYMNVHLAKGIPIDIGEMLKIVKENTADPDGKHKAIADKANVNVTIHRIEVQSDDPDRYAFRFVSAFRDAAKNPSQAIAVLREG